MSKLPSKKNFAHQECVRMPFSSHESSLSLCQFGKEKKIFFSKLCSPDSWWSWANSLFVGSSTWPLEIAFCPYCHLLFIRDTFYVFQIIIFVWHAWQVFFQCYSSFNCFTSRHFYVCAQSLPVFIISRFCLA